MKKTKTELLIVGGILVGTLASCKKDRVCECTHHSMVEKKTLVKVTKKQAKDICVSTSETDGTGTVHTITCSLK